MQTTNKRLTTTRLEILALALLATPLLIALSGLAYRSTLRLQINFNEGWNAYHSVAAVSNGQLYFPSSALITNNYPPLSFFIVGSLARIVGDAIFAGRIVSWISFLSIAAMIVAIVRRLTSDSVAGCLGAILFTAYAVIHFNFYIGSNDPQWLGACLDSLWIGLFEDDSAIMLRGRAW